ncbi:MAG: class I SAM-dependent methyltransferase [Chlamydiota bacterium]
MILLIINLSGASQGISLVNDYQENSSLQWNWAMESLKKFPFNENDKVLDVGCGDGKITALIAKQVTHGIVIGFDISEKMLAHASANFSSDNLLFVQGNATSIPFKKQFDKLVSFCTLHWVLKQEQALQSFRSSTTIGLELGSLVAGGYGAVKGVLGLTN